MDNEELFIIIDSEGSFIKIDDNGLFLLWGTEEYPYIINGIMASNHRRITFATNCISTYNIGINYA